MTEPCFDLAKSHDRPALISSQGSAEISFADLGNAILKRRIFAAKDSVVVLRAESTIDFVITFLSYLQIKQTIALIPPGISKAPAMWQDSRLRLLGRAVEVDHLGQLVSQSPCTEVLRDPQSRVILFTSGSSGEPKAVQLSAENIRANTQAVIQSLSFKEATSQFLFLPLSYSFGVLGQLLPALAVGVQTNLLGHFAETTKYTTDTVMSGMWSGVPSHWEALLRMTQVEPRPFVTHVISAGAPLSVELRRRLVERFPNATIFNNYGLTEAAPRVLSFSSRQDGFFSDASGFPVGDWQVRLSNDGELEIKGAQVMLSYLGDAAATDIKIREGWLNSGDFAHISSEGLVTILGRIDDVFNIGGEKTSVSEIAGAIRLISGILDCAILKEPDSVYGSRLTALVICKDEVVDRGRDAFIRDLEKKLSTVKIPRDFRRIQSLPRNQNGKVSFEDLNQLKLKAPSLWL